MNYDLSLLALRGFHGGDVADVRACVCHIYTGNDQDALCLCGIRQSFTMRLDLHKTFSLEKRNSLFALILCAGVSHMTSQSCCVPVCQGKTTECPPQRWTPPTPCSSEWGPPPPSAPPGPQETAWHRKPHFLSRRKKRSREKERDTGREPVREVTVTSSAVFPSSWDQRKWLFFRPEDPSYYKEAACHNLTPFPFMCQTIY